MRIALVCPYDVGIPGGVQAHVLALAGRLRADGDDVVVLAPSEGEASEGIIPVGGSVRVPFNDSQAPIAVSPVAVRRALVALDRFRPDVVHVHEPGAPLLSLAVCLRGPHPLVGTFHAWSDSDRLYRIARPLLRAGIDRLSAKLAVSAAAASYHAGALGLPERSFREVPNGVDVGRFGDAEPLPEIVDAGGERLLFVGRLERRKGVEELVRAFIRLKAERPGLRLLVVGDGPERPRCQNLLPARLRSDVLFLGEVAQEDLPRFYASAHVFVSPALGGESFGIVLLEAMAAGLPVVASAIPGYRSVVRDGIEGRLVPPGDSRALASAVGTVLDNAALREAMADEGRHTVASYDWSVIAQRTRDIYRSLTTAP